VNRPLFPAPAVLTSNLVSVNFQIIFQEEYRAIRPRAPAPPIVVRFRRFTSLNTTIRLREGRVLVSLSDLLEGAPESVLRAIAHILLAKLYNKKQIDPTRFDSSDLPPAPRSSIRQNSFAMRAVRSATRGLMAATTTSMRSSTL